MRLTREHIYVLFLFMAFIACKEKNTDFIALNTEVSKYKETVTVDVKGAVLLSKLTLEEKIEQTNDYNGFFNVTVPSTEVGDAKNKYEHLKNGCVVCMPNVLGVKDVKAVQKIAGEENRLGIPLFIGIDVIQRYKTISPIPLAEAVSWDLDEIAISTKITTLEASAAGIKWIFAPRVYISRDIRWCHVMTAVKEDTGFGRVIVQACVSIFQRDQLASNETIIACAKHFGGYGFAEAGHDYNTADFGLSTLFNAVSPPLITAKEVGVKTFMNSLNEWNGVPATVVKYWQRDILKVEWKYEGFVVSEMGSTIEIMANGHVKDCNHAAKISANVVFVI